MPDQPLENNSTSAMLKEVGRLHAEKKGQTTEAEELPKGTSPIKASEETAVESEETAEETPAAAEGEPGGDAPASEEEPIRINGQVFKTQTEAFAYAEQLAREKELTDAHSAGVREALEASRQPTQPAAEPEDDFDQRFYSNPKETLRGLKEEAKREALAIMQQEQNRERLWGNFLTENPDIRRKDAERILMENWGTIGHMTDFDRAQKLLAQKVRSEYEEIAGLLKPRTVVESKKQAISPSGGSPGGVTPKKKDDAPLSMAQQMRKLRGL